MDKRINLELRGRQPAMLKELDLSGCKTMGEIEGLTEEFLNLELLDLSNSNLTTLKTFPKLPNLRKIDLNGNRLSKGLEHLKDCTNLKHIIINGNRFRDLEVLEPLNSLQHLTHLEVGMEKFSDSVFTTEERRMKLFERLKSLEYLDTTDIDGNDEDEDDDGLPLSNGIGKIREDISDGDDELEDEEGEEDEEDDDDDDDDSDEEDEDGINITGTYDPNGVVLQEEYDDEDYNEDASDDEEEDDEDPEPEQSTRGKKRKLDDPAV
jgi:hypothetical protein